MIPRPLPFLALAFTLSLGACAAPEGYPSLSTRDSERVSGAMQAPQTPAFTPAPPAPATLESLGDLAVSAREAHDRFLAAAGQTRAPVSAAAGSEIGSIGWSAAQAEIAALDSIRNGSVIALADIDRLYVESALSGADLAELEAVRDEIGALVEDQDQLIASMLATLAS